MENSNRGWDLFMGFLGGLLFVEIIAQIAIAIR